MDISVRRVIPYRLVPKGINILLSAVKSPGKPTRLFFVAILMATFLLPLVGGIVSLQVEAAIPDVKFCTTNCPIASTPLGSLRVPWMYGNSYIGGYGYGCGDHTTQFNDQYALDFHTPEGTPLAAVFSGTVYTGYDGDRVALGNWVAIYRSDGWVATYGHMSKVVVGTGMQVTQGQYIGDAGNTGNSTGAHLHFSLRQNSTGRFGGIFDGTSVKPEPMGLVSSGGTSTLAAEPYTNFGPSCNPSLSASKTNVANEAVGGWWIGPTPNDRTILPTGPGQFRIGVHGSVKDGGYIDRINITAKVGTGPWQIISSTDYGNAFKDAEAFATLTTGNQTIYYSFDVYERYTPSTNQSSAIDGFHLAPNGVRILCAPSLSASQCNSLTALSADPLPGSNGYLGYGGLAGVCTTAPTTTSTTTGATAGNQGWWRSTATVKLSADAPCGPIGLQTYYSINGGSQNTYSGPINLTQEGIYNITFHSVDGMGNVEGDKSVQVKIDWTPPVTAGTATGPRDTNGIFRNDVTAGLNATDNLSGVDYEQHSFDGGTNWLNQTGAANTFLIKGSGVYRFLYRSADIAGNMETAKDSGPIIINKYVIFSNNTSNSLRFLSGTGINIAGDIFTNGSTTIKYNTNSVLGTTFTEVGSGNILSGNTGVTIPTFLKATSVPMLSYPLSLYQSLATVVFPSDLYMDSVSSTMNGIIYVQGNVQMYNVALSGPLSIVATGTINDWTTDSTYQTGDPHNGVLLYAGKDIILNSTGNRNLGLLYAPTGTVSVRATGLTLQGSIVGDQVEINSATNFNLSYNAAFSNATYSLPLSAMGLVVPTTPVPALPTVPTLYKPTNGSTVTTNASISWNSSTGAVGYQLQVSKVADFSTQVVNMSYFTTGTRQKLAAGTYYWRVRAVNQARTSAWSTVRSFKTQ